MYNIIFVDNDGYIQIRTTYNKEALRTFFILGEGREFGPTDYALIKGEVIKSFDNKTFDLKGEIEDAKTDGNK